MGKQNQAYLYEIQNKINGMCYIGMTYSNKKIKTHEDRFLEHMNGKGSIYLKKELNEGTFSIDDFSLRLIEKSENIEYIRKREKEEINIRNTLYPNGYNGNCGNYIVMTPERIKKIKNTKLKNKDNYNTTKGYSTFINLDSGEKVYEKIDNPLLIEGNYVGVKSKHFVTLREKNAKKESNQKEKILNGGRTNKEKDADVWLRSDEFRKQITENENWKKGREKYKKRMKSKNFSDLQICGWKKTSNKIKEHWSERDSNYKKKRTKNGLNSMNSLTKCEHCGFESNKGNIKRWHNDNCRYKEQ